MFWFGFIPLTSLFSASFVRVEEYLKMTLALQKQMTPLTTIKVLNLQHYGGLIEMKPHTVGQFDKF